MASLNLSANGLSITKSYQNVVNASPSGAASASSTYGVWAVFAVQAPLVSAFQQDSGKESVLKVQSTGEGELVDLIDEFSDGRIQFAFVKVKDTNSGLPKNVLIGWCGEGVPERTKGYFTSHLAAVSKLLHGYHVQITARSDRDLTPESIVQKVADSSGSKYSGADTKTPSAAGGPPPALASKPVFTPTRVGGSGGSFNPLGGRSKAPQASSNTDEDGWGADAPQVTRTQLEKVESAYKPTKVNISDLTSQREPSRYKGPDPVEAPSDVVRGGYQPIGKVDIAAIRRQAKESGSAQDDRPTTVKGAYEPVGKVDIAAIRAKAQGPGQASTPPSMSPSITGASSQNDEAPKSLAERSAAFNQSERMTSMPKPKVAKQFGANTSSFTGTKAPAPGGFEAKPLTSAAPVGVASRTFADEGGKTPAQIWAEKKARERGSSTISPQPTPGYGGPASPIKTQPSGEGAWKSGYTGKSWAPVQTTRTGQSVASDRTGPQEPEAEPEPAASPAGGVGSIRDRFANAPPMGAANIGRQATGEDDFSAPAPPPIGLSSKPNAGARALPGFPPRPQQAPEVEEDEDRGREEHVNIPTPPPQARSPSPPTPADVRESSPVRIAMPVSRGREPEIEPPEERFTSPPVPTQAMARAIPPPQELDDEPERDLGRSAATAAAGATFGAAAAAIAQPGTDKAGKRAVIQYDYDKAEDNEIDLKEGEYVSNIEMVDEDWWMGTNSKGESGLFPANYVEIVDDDAGQEEAAASPPPAPAANPAPAAAASHTAPAPQSKGPTATAQYDYEAAEDNELSFPDGAKILNLEFPDDDWWFGEYNGKQGLFPANYVQLDE